jgi:hypothetical protein
MANETAEGADDNFMNAEIENRTGLYRTFGPKIS